MRTSSVLPAIALALAACSDSPGPEGPGDGLSFGGPGSWLAIDHIAIDDAGAALVGGRFTGTIALGAGPPLTSVAQEDAFIARIDADGRVAWARGFGGLPAGSNRSDLVTGIAAMADGTMIVTGYVEGTVDLGGGPLEHGPDGGWGVLFIARYASDGTHLWSQRWQGGTSQSLAGTPTIGPDGSIYVGAEFWGGANIGELHLEFDHEHVVVKLDADGAVQWAQPLRPTPPTEASWGFYGMSDPLVIGDDVYVSGLVQGPIDFGTGPLASAEIGSAASYATYVVRLAAATGERRAVHGYPAAESPPGGRQIMAAPDGGLVLAGPLILRLAADLSIASTIDLSSLTNFDSYDGKLAFRANGEMVWIAANAYVHLAADGAELARTTFASRGPVTLSGLAVGPDDRIRVVGGYDGAFVLGDQSFTDPGGPTRGFIATMP